MTNHPMGNAMPRHALLFELIRQHDMAKFINQKKPVDRPIGPDEHQQFIAMAENSFLGTEAIPAVL